MSSNSVNLGSLSGTTGQTNSSQSKNVDPEVRAYMNSHPGVSESEAEKKVKEKKPEKNQMGHMDQSDSKTPPTGSIFKSN